MVEMLSASPGFTRPCAECGQQKRTVYLIHDHRALCEEDYINYRAKMDRLDYANLDEIYAADREAEGDEPDENDHMGQCYNCDFDGEMISGE